MPDVITGELLLKELCPDRVLDIDLAWTKEVQVNSFRDLLDAVISVDEEQFPGMLMLKMPDGKLYGHLIPSKGYLAGFMDFYLFAAAAKRLQLL